MSERHAPTTRRLTIPVALAVVGVLALGGLAAEPAAAQEAGGKGPPALGLSHGAQSGLGLAQVGRSGRPAQLPAERVQQPVYRPYYYYAPWTWYVTPSYKYKLYPPPVALEPRLGLQYNYPYAWQMGLQLPYDDDPLYTYSLGPYRGVVRSPQTPEWIDEAAGVGALSLLKKGEFKEAGLLLAEEFRLSDEARPPLLLTEALFALGKYRHAEIVLRHALNLDGALDAVPEDVAGHFPSRADYEKRVQALVDAKTAHLLTAYLLLFTQRGTDGLDRLAKMMDESPKDEIPGQLYRHFLGKAFVAPEKADAPAPEKKDG